MKQYKCSICGYIYDAMDSDEYNNINPGTQFESLPADWICPVCGADKSDFNIMIKEL